MEDVIRPTVDVMENGSRQLALRKAPEIHDVVTAVYAHERDYAV